VEVEADDHRAILRAQLLDELLGRFLDVVQHGLRAPARIEQQRNIDRLLGVGVEIYRLFDAVFVERKVRRFQTTDITALPDADKRRFDPDGLLRIRLLTALLRACHNRTSQQAQSHDKRLAQSVHNDSASLANGVDNKTTVRDSRSENFPPCAPKLRQMRSDL